MAHAALLSGMALANSGLGFAHGVAAALGVYAKVPHGLACAIMLPIALRVNRDIAEKPLADLARAALPLASPNDAEAADELLGAIDDLCADLKVPAKLSAVGVQARQLDDLVHGSRGNSMNGNPPSSVTRSCEKSWRITCDSRRRSDPRLATNHALPPCRNRRR